MLQFDWLRATDELAGICVSSVKGVVNKVFSMIAGELRPERKPTYTIRFSVTIYTSLKSKTLKLANWNQL